MQCRPRLFISVGRYPISSSRSIPSNSTWMTMKSKVVGRKKVGTSSLLLSAAESYYSIVGSFLRQREGSPKKIQFYNCTLPMNVWCPLCWIFKRWFLRSLRHRRSTPTFLFKTLLWETVRIALGWIIFSSTNSFFFDLTQTSPITEMLMTLHWPTWRKRRVSKKGFAISSAIRP